MLGPVVKGRTMYILMPVPLTFTEFPSRPINDVSESVDLEVQSASIQRRKFRRSGGTSTKNLHEENITFSPEA